MKKLFLIGLAAALLFVLVVYKDDVLNSFNLLGFKAKNKLSETIDEEIRAPISSAIEKKIDETFDKIKESIVGENQKETTPLRVAADSETRTELSKTEVFAWTNVERVKSGMTIFLPDSKLDAIAKLRLEDMFQKQYFEHVSPSGESASTEAKVVDYEYASIGENIALGNFGSDQKLITAWMNSPGHRANILSSKFTKLGVAVGEGIFEGEKTWIAVQIFAKPLSACPTVSEDLKSGIEAKKLKLADLQIQADTLKSDIESRNPKTKEEVRIYNEKVEQYNALAAEINILIDEIKADIQTYNNEVNAFNFCIAG